MPSPTEIHKDSRNILQPIFDMLVEAGINVAWDNRYNPPYLDYWYKRQEYNIEQCSNIILRNDGRTIQVTEFGYIARHKFNLCDPNCFDEIVEFIKNRA